jgi:glycosyltransferase involved in cell wall biosynthesis
MFDSISRTIGMEYEAIVFNNREKKYGICKAYNEAAKGAKGDYLCFAHEDIVIKTNAWGRELVKFAEQNCGCGAIGIAGGKWTNRNFFGWWSSDFLIKIHDGSDSDKQNNLDESDLIYKYANPNNEVFSKAVCLDGVFLFVKKDIWENNKFDEDTFRGFHFYDADFTFSISQKYQNYVYFGIDIYHFSKGKADRAFYENMFLFQKKHKKKLPYYLPNDNFSFRQKIKAECRNMRSIYRLYRENGFSCLQSLYRVLYINISFL